jgi:hypothetical protein
VLGQHRSTQRKVPRRADDEDALTDDIVALARQYGRYGYRRITALLRDAGWHGEPQAGRTYLAARGPEGAAEATQAGSPMAERWFVYPAAA